MARVAVILTDLPPAKVSMTLEVTPGDGDSPDELTRATVVALAVQHLWRTGELQQFVVQNQREIVEQVLAQADPAPAGPTTDQRAALDEMAAEARKLELD